MTEVDFIKKLEATYSEIECLNADIKKIKEDIKAKGLKPAKLAKIAKLRSQAKVSDFVRDSKEIIDLVERSEL